MKNNVGQYGSHKKKGKHIMKKLFAVLLALALACTALVLVPAAEGTNPQYTFEYTEDAPVVDGVVDPAEYGTFPVDSWSYSDGALENTFQNINYLITDDEDLSIDFYATWTDDDLYLAWVVNTEYDFRIPTTETNDAYMYKYCYIQLIMTSGAPDNTTVKYQTAEWSGDYLDIGLCLKDDGESYKVAWTQPAAANGALTLSDWEFSGSREGTVTTYEVRLPWTKTGVLEKGDGAQFGMNWGVGVQENYDDVKQGIVEWTDGAVGVKNADAACVITLAGGDEKTQVGIELPVSRDESPAGDLPAGLENSLIQILQLEAAVTAESVSFVTDAANIANYNTTWSHAVLLRPVEDNSETLEGYYTVVEAITGAGEAVGFTGEVEDGDVAIIAHTDGSEGATGGPARQALGALVAGDNVYLHGVQWNTETGKAAWLYNNAQLALVPDPADQIVGMWGVEGNIVVFAEDGTGTKNGEAFEWAMTAEGVLTIDGTETAWSIAEGKLTLGEDTLDALTAGNYTELNKLITTAQLLKAEDYKEGFDALTEALTKANEAVEANYTSLNQADIDAAKDALQAAIDGLVKNETEESTEASTEESTTSTTSTATSSEPADDEGGFPIWIIIVIAVAVVAIVVVVIVVAKKKK